jgi:hypothetical protein
MTVTAPTTESKIQWFHVTVTAPDIMIGYNTAVAFSQRLRTSGQAAIDANTAHATCKLGIDAYGLLNPNTSKRFGLGTTAPANGLCPILSR